MSTFEVKIETLTVFPHPNADRLDLAQVGLYNTVVGKDTWKTGDKALYIPEYAVLPAYLIEALGLEGKLAGSKNDRVKPVRLRGELSQGLVAPLSLLPADALERLGDDANFADELEITKWEPAIPISMSGEVEGNYGLVGWIDIENIKKYPDMFTEGEEVIVDEKIHGTATLTTFVNPLSEDREILVSSKGLGEKKFVLKESDGNLYWRVVRDYNLVNLAETVATHYSAYEGNFDEENDVATHAKVTRVAIFGETFGKVQDLDYGYVGNDLGFRVFDIFIEFINENGTQGRWLNASEVEVEAKLANVPLVPRLYAGPFSIGKIKELASGKEQVSGKELHIREGVVVRPLDRGDGYDLGKKKIGKFVSEAYLTRKPRNGQEVTEYQ